MFLCDEIDASNPQAIATAHAALDNGVLDGPDGMIKRHPDFRFLAAANTYGNGATLDYVGRNPLDAATLSRFAFITIDYDEDLERNMVKEAHGKKYLSWVKLVQTTREIAMDLKLRHIVSPRASRDGAALLKAGLSHEKVFNMTVVKGLAGDPDSLIKLNELLKKRLKEDFKAIENQPKIIEDQNQAINKLIDDMSEASASFLGARELVISMEECQRLLESTLEISEKIKKSHRAIDSAQAIVNQIEAIKDTLSQFTKDADTLHKASAMVEEARELETLSDDFAKTKSLIEGFLGDSKAKQFLDAVDELSDRAQNTTGLKKAILNIVVGKTDNENILG